MKTLWQEGTSFSQTKQVNIWLAKYLWLPKVEHYSTDLDKTVHYSQHSKQQEHLHVCAAFPVPKAPVPKDDSMAWSATEEPSAPSSSPFIARSKQTCPLPPENKQFLGSGYGHLDLLSCHVTGHRTDSGPEGGWTLQLAFSGRVGRDPFGPPVVCLSQHM